MDLHVYKTLGAILSHGVSLTGIIPIRLCRSSVYSIIHGKPNEDDKMLLEDLLLYLTDYDRNVTKAALADFTTLRPMMVSHLTDMFVRFNLNVMPRADTFKQNILNLAKSEIGIKPLYLCNEMRSGIPDVHMEVFWNKLTTADINKVYQSLQPNPERVVDLIRTDADDRFSNNKTQLSIA